MQNEAGNDQGRKIIRSNTAANNFFIKQGQGFEGLGPRQLYPNFPRVPPTPPPRPPNKHLKVKWTGSWSGAQSMLKNWYECGILIH